MAMRVGGGPSRGFTIVEVMLVLGVTGALIAAAIILVAGKERQTEFSQSANDIQSKIQQIIGTVSNGSYPTYNNFNCSSATYTGVPFVTSGSTPVGENQGCIFLGKAIHFYASSSGNASTYSIYTVIGRQCSAGVPGSQGCQPLTSLGSASPVVLTPAPGNAFTTSYPDEAQTGNLEDNLKVYSIIYCLSFSGGSCTSWSSNVGSLAFISNTSATEPSTTVGGGVDLFGIPSYMGTGGLDSGPPPDPLAAQAINVALQSQTPTVPSQEAEICFVSGTTANQSALLTITEGDGELTSTLNIESDARC